MRPRATYRAERRNLARAQRRAFNDQRDKAKEGKMPFWAAVQTVNAMFGFRKTGER